MKTVAKSSTQGLRVVDIQVAYTAGRSTITTTNVDSKTDRVIASVLKAVLQNWSVGQLYDIAYNPMLKREVHIDLTPHDEIYSGTQILAGIMAALLEYDFGKPPLPICIVGSMDVSGNILAVEYPDRIAALVPPQIKLFMAEESARLAAKTGRPVGIVNLFSDIVEAVNDHLSVWVPGQIFTGANVTVVNDEVQKFDVDLSDIAGQEKAKSLLLVALAGRHNILITGPPGEGKTMLAKAASGMQPPLFPGEVLEVHELRALAGLPLCGTARSYQSITKNIPASALFGGGSTVILPGAVSLAHRGILHIDEFLELTPARIEALRSVIEDKITPITRTEFKATLPADFQLVATANRCKCTYRGHPTIKCSCSIRTLSTYLSRVSGAMLDRIDIVTHAEVVPMDVVFNQKFGITSKEAQSMVEKVWGIQFKRWGECVWNSTAPTRDVLKLEMSEMAKALLLSRDSELSVRGAVRAIRVARTIADLAGHKVIELDDMLTSTSTILEGI